MEQMIIADNVRAVCLPNKQFDSNKFEPHIKPAELQYIKPFLGKTFYDSIRAEYLADSIGSANQTIIDNYLKPALCWFTLAKASPFMHINIQNGGFYVNDTEYSRGATDKQRSDIETLAFQNAESFLDEAKEYIELNYSSYPLYYASKNIDNDTQIIGGLILGGDD